MAWEVVEKGAERLIGMYPRFEEIGDYVEGNFMGIEDDDYGNRRITLYIGEDEETGEAKTQQLPPAADLRKYYDKLHLGEYVKIEFIKVIPSNSEKFADKKIFKVLVDHSRDVEFGGEEEE